MKTILCIDDDPILLKLTSEYLKRVGFSVLQAGNGSVGIRLLGEKRIDLVLTDLCMPVTDGFEVLKFAVANFPDLPVIVISGIQAVSDAVVAMKAGAWDYITKPVESFALLEHAVRRAFERAGLLKENRLYRENLEEEVTKRTIELRGEIQERKKLEAALKETKDRLRMVIDSLPVMIHAHDKDGRYIFWNKECERVTGYSADEMLYKDKEPMNQDSGTSDYRDHESVIRTKNGKDRTISWSSLSRQCPIPGWHLWETGIDITDRKKAEKLLRSSLNEKEILLKEIHHRVKNNLQIISSLLSLQLSGIDDELLRSLFIQSQNRIKSMALVHEELYESEDLERINFRSYLYNLIAYLNNVYENSERITFSFNLEDLLLPINIAIPCGLIMNELLTNAFKHGYKERSCGTINVTICETEHEGKLKIMLTVKDDGCGLPDDFDIDDSTTLGLQLVASLVSQLDGSIKVYNDQGAVFTVYFETEMPERESETKITANL